MSFKVKDKVRVSNNYEVESQYRGVRGEITSFAIKNTYAGIKQTDGKSIIVPVKHLIKDN
jgi:hypothetical protein